VLTIHRAISRQECGAYPPDKFVPDRFLKSDGPAIADPFDYAFGFGKRSVLHLVHVLEH
jgi:hypothetical protein